MSADDRLPGEPGGSARQSPGTPGPVQQPPVWPPGSAYGGPYQPSPGGGYQQPYWAGQAGEPPSWPTLGTPDPSRWIYRPPRTSSPVAIAAGVGLLIFHALLTLIGRSHFDDGPAGLR